jgi:hypothetical protein
LRRKTGQRKHKFKRVEKTLKRQKKIRKTGKEPTKVRRNQDNLRKSWRPMKLVKKPKETWNYITM